MFNYLGSKYWLARRYPEPKHDLIIEPFAGSAQYSLLHWKKDVVLVEKKQNIYDLWIWLQRARPRDILRLPTPRPKEKIAHRIPEARTLIALGMNRGTSNPQTVAGSWPQLPALWDRKKEIIAENLHKIRHWKIIHGDGTTLKNQRATWFVDPPYQGLRTYSSTRPIDFERLGRWCRSRRGQVIVCEQEGADWLPFENFRKSKTMKDRSVEVVWIK